MSPQPPATNSSGCNTPDFELESIVPVHTTAVRRLNYITVQSENTVYTDDHITAKYLNRGADVVVSDGQFTILPTVKPYEFQTTRKVGKTRCVAGSTLCATIITNRHQIGSVLRSPLPIFDVLPMVHTNDLVLGGWDISSLPMDKAMERAKVLDYDLQRQVKPHMALLGRPLPSIYYPNFIAANYEARVDNVAKNQLDRVIVFWTVNVERYSGIIPGVNDTPDNHSELSPSTLFAVAAILEGEPFVNGAPQNTFMPGVIALAEPEKSFIGGDDLKSGQMKLKSVLAEFLVNASIKPLSIASYNYLSNNDGPNLSAEPQFRSKEISKSSIVDDMMDAHCLLYKPPVPGAKGKAAKGEHPDHIVVIKYVPAVGDSKRAIDEYYSEIFCGGRQTINIFNECEDSLLATPLILDLTILTELLTRVKYRGEGQTDFACLQAVLSLLSYMRLSSNLVSTDVVNSLSRQRNVLQSFLKVFVP
ncbi:Myo-inositol-1-phosphate synthase [Suillus weaverae]|nr:Myo-inositol-1-phosphate synthase [Suillus weaverae]